MTLDEIAATGRLDRLDDLLIPDADGHPSLRLGIFVELAVANGDQAWQRHAMADVVLDYAETFGARITHYHPRDASQLRSIAGVDLAQVFHQRAEEPDDLAANESFDAILYGFPDGIDDDAPTLHYINATGETAYRRWSGITAYLPASWPETAGYPALVDLVRRWCDRVKPAYGTAGLSILFNEGQQTRSDRLAAFPLAKRFPGLDLPESARWYAMVREEARPRLRTINWLTVLGDELVTELGGIRALRATLPESCPVTAFDGGVIVTAGERPEIGDVNAERVPAAYRAMSAALRPVRFEGYARPLIDAPPPLDALDETLAWVRRFD